MPLSFELSITQAQHFYSKSKRNPGFITSLSNAKEEIDTANMETKIIGDRPPLP
jgi:hypothetical protein